MRTSLFQPTAQGIVACFVLGSCLSALPTAAAAQSVDERAVLAVVTKLFDGMRARDTAHDAEYLRR